MNRIDSLISKWGLNESTASEQAQKLGLKHMGFNRWGKGDEVTHKIVNGMLKSVKAMERDVEQSDREYIQQKKERERAKIAADFKKDGEEFNKKYNKPPKKGVGSVSYDWSEDPDDDTIKDLFDQLGLSVSVEDHPDYEDSDMIGYTVTSNGNEATFAWDAGSPPDEEDWELLFKDLGIDAKVEEDPEFADDDQLSVKVTLKKGVKKSSKTPSYKDIEDMVPNHWEPQLSDYFRNEAPDVTSAKFKNGKLELKTRNGDSIQISMKDHELQIGDSNNDKQLEILKKIAKTGMTNKWEVVKDLYDKLDLYYPEGPDEFDVEDNKRIAKEALEHLED